jgi:hypothetical protein
MAGYRTETGEVKVPTEGSRMAQPFAGHDVRPFAGLSLRQRIAVVAAADASQQPHPFEKRDAIIAFLDALPVCEYLVEPVAVDLNPFAFEQNESFLRGHQLAALGGCEPFALEGDLDRKIHQAPQPEETARFFADPDIDLWTRGPPTFPLIGHRG